MKIQIVVLFSILVVVSRAERTPYHLPEKETENLLQVGSQCLTETNVPTETWDAIKKDKYEHDDIYKKFLFCMMTKLEFVDDQGHPIKNKLYGTFKEDDLKKVIDKCGADPKGDTPVDVTYSFYKCCIDNTNIRIAI